MANRPGFFKFYLPSCGEENQKIPPRFVQSVQGTWQNNVVLRDRYNNLWNVKVEMAGGHWYFRDGWTKFLDDNKMKGGYMVVYEYFSPGLLDFKIHGLNACSTEGVGGRITDNSVKRYIEIESDDYDTTDEGENSFDDDYDSPTEEENGQDDHFQLEQATDDTDSNPVPATEEEENQSVDPFEAAEMTDDATSDGDYFPTTEEADQRDVCPVGKDKMSGTASSSRRRTRRDYSWCGAEIFRTGLVPYPRNPYFVTQIRRSRPGELYIPKEMLRNHTLELPETVTFFDPQGRQFRARLKIWSDERTFYCGGWKSLCKVNMLNEGDACICEFVENGDNMSIRVSFFPPK